MSTPFMWRIRSVLSTRPDMPDNGAAHACVEKGSSQLVFKPMPESGVRLHMTIYPPAMVSNIKVSLE